MTEAEFKGYDNDEHGHRRVSTRRGPVVALGPALTEADLDRAQDALGCRLPADYRRWLLLCNGGIPTWGKFQHAFFSWLENELTRADTVDTFLGVGHPNPGMDLLQDNVAKRGVAPAGMISIARPNFQDENRRLCLAVDGEHRGKVFDWFIHTPPRRRGKTAEPIEMCFERFPSFEMFWDSLHTDPPYTPLKAT